MPRFKRPLLPFGRLACIAALATVLLSAAHAAKADDTDRLVIGGGVTDVIHDKPAAGDLRLEYRSGISLLSLASLDVPYFTINPWFGGEVTTRGALWGGGGFQIDIPLSHGFYLTPNVGVGLFERGTGKRLGSFIEFRSQAELSFQFDDLSRVSATFGHTSNAGLTSRNPGTEAITFSYQVPFGMMMLK